MSYAQTIESVRSALQDTFAQIDCWFLKPDAVLHYRPHNGGWTVAEILEHITLTSHFLLIVIRNGTQKAHKRVSRHGFPAHGESDLQILEAIGTRGSFSWTRPEH